MTVTIPLSLTDVSACASPITTAKLGANEAEKLAKTLKAIADPARLRLISIVASAADAEACVCDLTEPLDLSQPTVSHHLKVLVDAGILQREKRATWAYYSLVPGSLETIANSIVSV